MELLHHLALGFSVALTPVNLLYCLVGCTLGTFIGVLPGVGPLAAVAMLLPTTFVLPPAAAVIMLAGIFYGAQYGGSTTSILVNMPGDASAVVTCIDGHEMARQGRAGPALAMSAIGSFFAGCVATAVIAVFAPVLTELALKFGPSEYFALLVLGLVTASTLSPGSIVNAMAMVAMGLLLGIVGTDVQTSTLRYTFGFPQLEDGVNLVAVAIGLFGFSHVIANLDSLHPRELHQTELKRLMPSKADLKASWKSVVRGTGIGSLLGVLPGGGAVLGSFVSYMVEKKVSRTPERFGHGAIEGVAGPESANNAASQTSFIPLLTLGIPPNPVIALIGGAMMIQGIAPGPEVITRQPEFFWAIVTSMWLGNAMLIVLNLPLIGIWVRMLRIPYGYLYPSVILFSCIGIYSVNNSAFDVMSAAVFSLFGYICLKLDCPPGPLLLGFVLGPMMEQNLRRAMLLSHGDPTVFVRHPISLGLLLTAAAIVGIAVAPAIRRKREQVFVGEGDT